MESSNKNELDFLSVLTRPHNYNNPFILLSNSSKNSNFKDFNPFGFSEDNYSFELRCPICLARVTLASRPENCLHIFCRPCLEKWNSQSNKCPYCRIKFNKILKVSYSESWVVNQYS